MGAETSRPFHDAATAGNVDSLAELCHQVVHSSDHVASEVVNREDVEGQTALEIACSSLEMDKGTLRRRRAASLLLSAKADLSHADRRGWTALHHACSVGDSEVAEFLLRAGAEPDARDSSGLRPQDVLSMPFRGLGVEDPDDTSGSKAVGCPPAAVRATFDELLLKFRDDRDEKGALRVWLGRAVPGVSDDELEVHWQRPLECQALSAVALFQCVGPKPWDLVPVLGAFVPVAEGAFEGKVVFCPTKMQPGTYRAVLMSDEDDCIAASPPFSIKPNAARTEELEE